ncbi:LOW QUALITY PROTEIN: hypothetical protein HZS_4386 [Henneguya salminicola]|nr:LOW QUALITY PROTEIN: hypothetical protein HZS_4386 [Henneguya salminicola]
MKILYFSCCATNLTSTCLLLRLNCYLSIYHFTRINRLLLYQRYACVSLYLSFLPFEWLMIEEIEFACKYIISLISHRYEDRLKQLISFETTMLNITVERYKNHWHRDNPLKGSGFRSITIMKDDVDILIKNICQASNTPMEWFFNIDETTTIYIDPGNIMVRLESGGLYDLIISDSGEFRLESTNNYYPHFSLDRNPAKAFVPSYSHEGKISPTPGLPRFDASFEKYYSKKTNPIQFVHNGIHSTHEINLKPHANNTPEIVYYQPVQAF